MIEKHQIKINVDQQLDFKQLMKIKCQVPKFFFEFKKNRTVLLKEKEPEKKEHYHIIYLREQERLRKEKEKIKRKAELRRQQLDKAELELKRGITMTNIPAK